MKNHALIGAALNEHHKNDAREFVPGTVHGIVLVMGSWCTVLASGLLAPVLPQIAQRFAGVAHVDLLIGLIATGPAFSVALLAVPFGWLADRIGHKRVLTLGLLLYGLVGTLPYWMDSLYAIIATRLLVGVGEAAVMTASTAMLGLYFSGPTRGRWFAAQVATANALGVLVLLFGGYLGLFDWHTPFLAYAFALVLFAPSALLLKQPATEARREPFAPAPVLVRLAPLYVLNLIETVCLFTVVFQIAFLLQERGAQNSAQIGGGIAIAALGIASGATTSGLLGKRSVPLRVSFGFCLVGVSFLIIAALDDYWRTTFASLCAGFGCGFIIPGLLGALMQRTPKSAVGIVSGLWATTIFAGQFANPPLIVFLRKMTGSLSASIALIGGLCLALACAVALALDRKPVPQVAAGE